MYRRCWLCNIGFCVLRISHACTQTMDNGGSCAVMTERPRRWHFRRFECGLADRFKSAFVKCELTCTVLCNLFSKSCFAPHLCVQAFSTQSNAGCEIGVGASRGLILTTVLVANSSRGLLSPTRTHTLRRSSPLLQMSTTRSRNDHSSPRAARKAGNASVSPTWSTSLTGPTILTRATSGLRTMRSVLSDFG